MAEKIDRRNRRPNGEPIQTVIVELSPKEAHAISMLRSFSFGSVVIHKQQGAVHRIEKNESVMADDTKGLDLGEVVNQS